MLKFLKRFYRQYRIATCVDLLSKPERIAWDITFVFLFVLFVFGMAHLSVSTHKSFKKLIEGSCIVQGVPKIFSE